MLLSIPHRNIVALIVQCVLCTQCTQRDRKRALRLTINITFIKSSILKWIYTYWWVFSSFSHIFFSLERLKLLLFFPWACASFLSISRLSQGLSGRDTVQITMETYKIWREQICLIVGFISIAFWVKIFCKHGTNICVFVCRGDHIFMLCGYARHTHIPIVHNQPISDYFKKKFIMPAWRLYGMRLASASSEQNSIYCCQNDTSAHSIHKNYTK